MRKVIFVISTLVFAVVVTLLFKSCLYIKRDSLYVVKSGSSLSTVGSELEEEELISSDVVFKIYYKFWSILNSCDRIYAGEYKLYSGESYGTVLDKFCNDRSVSKTITIVEGTETREIVNAINDCGDLIGEKISLSNNRTLSEGAFLPETYTFKTGTSRSTIVEKMRTDMNEFLDYAWKKRDTRVRVKSKREAVVLASIVEKEAKVDAERARIASVYLNRMSRGMRLEADPTTIYEITRGRYKLQRPLTRKDTQINGEYNTYKRFGLPKTPICNPGKKSILAVLHPEYTNYIYFVAKSDGSGEHIFSNSYDKHLENVRKVKKLQSKTRR